MALAMEDRVTLLLNPQMVQDKKHVRDKYARVVLTKEQREKTIYTKRINNSSVSDYRPDPTKVWTEQFTEHERVNMVDEDGAHVFVNREDNAGGISASAGVILTFHGRATKTIAVDLTGTVPREMSLIEAESLEDGYSVRFPRFTLWEFKLHEVIYTDGPERNSRLMEAAEEQRARQEEKSLKTQEDFYRTQTAIMMALVEKIGNRGGQDINVKELLQSAGIKPTASVEEKEIQNEDLKAAMEDWEVVEKDPKAVTTGQASIDVTVTSADGGKRKKG